MVKGSRKSIAIFTVDLDTDLPTLPNKFEGMDNKEKRHIVKVGKKMLFQDLRANSLSSHMIIL